MRYFAYILLILIAMAVVHAEPPATSSPPVATAASPSEKFEKEIAAYEAADKKSPPPLGAVLFIGDSGIKKWSTLAEDFPDQQVINRGFGGSQMADATYFADRIAYTQKIIGRSMIDLSQIRQDLGTQLVVFFETTSEGSRHCSSTRFFDAAHRHAHMFRFQPNTNTLRFHSRENRIGDLFSHSFLHLQSARRQLDDAGDFRQPSDHSMAGKIRRSASLRSRTSSMLPVPLNS